MQYGFFDDEAMEYVVTRPDTPTSWSNYLGSTEYGAVIRKYPICKVPSYQIVNKIALEDLFVCDLEKIVKDIKFALWWENERMNKLKLEMVKCQKYVDLFNKITIITYYK